MIVVTIQRLRVSIFRMKEIQRTWAVAILAILASFGLASAQNQTSNTTDPTPTLTAATEEVKTNSTDLLQMQQEQLNKAETKLDELRGLVAEGLIARAQLETEEQTLVSLRAEVEATRKQIADAQQLLVKIQADQELARKQAALPKANVKLALKPYSGFPSGSTILRYTGSGSWSLAGLAELRSFFSSTFGRALPTSAIGQSATHNQLGYNHRNAVDVPLHPDSQEGRTLITYLQTQNIPFLAFRAAIPGVATGPHIHIGSPSHRL